MKHDRFKAKLMALDALRTTFDAKAAVPALRKALMDRSNFIVAKAATILGDAYLTDLQADVIAAFDRLLSTVEDDPGCRGKNALAKALKDLDHHDPDAFMRGLAHTQFEPAWGGKIDTAGSLRGTCAQALVACDIDPTLLLEVLTDHFVDSDKSVRIEIALAIAQLGRPESALLLRLKALCGDSEPEVVGQCLLSLLDVAPGDGIAFVSRFLDADDVDVRFEAVSVLAQAKSLAAIEHIQCFWAGEVAFELRRATVVSLAASPHREAAEFLLSVVETHPDELGRSALSALASSRFRKEIRERAEAEVAKSGSDMLQRAFDYGFADE
jgi:HEAT repeat protein